MENEISKVSYQNENFCLNGFFILVFFSFEILLILLLLFLCVCVGGGCVGDLGLYVYNVGGGKHTWVLLQGCRTHTQHASTCQFACPFFFHFPILADLTSHQRDQKPFFFSINQNIKGLFG